MVENKKFVFFITHSIGELDIVLPIICRLRSYGENYDFRIIFLVEELFDKFISEVYFERASKVLDVQADFLRMPNKFDYRDRSGSVIKNILFKYKANISNPFTLFKLFTILHNSSVVLHEYSCQVKTLRAIYIFSKILRKKIFTYMHGHACSLDTNVKKIRFCPKHSHFLNFHKHSERTYLKSGYVNQSIIGYPKFYPEWNAFIKKYFGESPFKERFILVYTRPINPYYMDENIYYELLTETCLSIYECFGRKVLIVIKPHPRERQDLIHKLLSNINVRYEISYKDSSVLSLHAYLSVSFWTSAILSSVAFGVPSVEFYKEAKLFYKIEPSGSSYKKIGLESVDNKKDLVLFMKKVFQGEYKQPVNALKILKENNDIDLRRIFDLSL